MCSYLPNLVVLLAELACRLPTFMLLSWIIGFIVSSFTVSAVNKFVWSALRSLDFTTLALLISTVWSDTSTTFIAYYLVTVFLDLLVECCDCLDTFKMFRPHVMVEENRKVCFWVLVMNVFKTYLNFTYPSQ